MVAEIICRGQLPKISNPRTKLTAVESTGHSGRHLVTRNKVPSAAKHRYPNCEQRSLPYYPGNEPLITIFEPHTTHATMVLRCYRWTRVHTRRSVPAQFPHSAHVCQFENARRGTGSGKETRCMSCVVPQLLLAR